jgi:hypothetical protein
MASVLRAIRSSPFLRGVAARLGAGYIRLIHGTVRWRIEGGASRDAIRSGRGRYVIPVWHGRLLAIPGQKSRALNVHALISANRDGDIIAACVARFGVPSVRGSSWNPNKADRDKGGREALDGARALLLGTPDVTVVLTPDGPRGPRMRCQKGVAALSVSTGALVVPFAYATRRARVLRSWDRFLAPFPFDRGAAVFGDPIAPPERSDPAALEAHRFAIEAALLEATYRADVLCGRDPVAPAMEPAFEGAAMAPWPPVAPYGAPLSLPAPYGAPLSSPAPYGAPLSPPASDGAPLPPAPDGAPLSPAPDGAR